MPFDDTNGPFRDPRWDRRPDSADFLVAKYGMAEAMNTLIDGPEPL